MHPSTWGPQLFQSGSNSPTGNLRVGNAGEASQMVREAETKADALVVRLHVKLWPVEWDWTISPVLLGPC